MKVAMFTRDFATSFFTLIDATPTDPNVITHSDGVGINRVYIFRIIVFRYLHKGCE